ncbi:hypothetical protein ACTHQ4_20875 [Alkalicoccobacillus gibsonii]|uniref:hypothetical protein n=1 Tax=Alkalicoccobacillus gibsonii TaxID=79881 RepID=UPI003F7B6910
MFGYGAFDLFLYAGFLGIQYFLSTRNSLFWGGLLPVVFIIWRTWIFFTNGESLLSFVIVLLLGLAFLISGWVTGRKALSERRKKELNKMKTLDIS